MKQYSFSLLVLLLSTVSTSLAIPCHAQSASDSKINTTNNISSEKVSTKDNRESQVSNADNSANGKSTVISETTEKTLPVSTKANSRIPIGSRIFAAPSMEQ